MAERCDDCQADYEAIYWCPDHVWQEIKPLPTEMGGLLCVECVHRRAKAAGYTLRFSASDKWWGDS